jgi:starch synthase
MPEKRLLFAVSEVYPFAKSGGLADVGHSLPRALAATLDVTVVLPLYRFIDRKTYGIERRRERFEIMLGGDPYPVSLYECRYEGIRYLFVYTPLLSDRDYAYGPPDKGYEDNALRFGLFSYAIVRLAQMLRSDIVHLNDWQTALAALLISSDASVTAKTVYTIHNLVYQGIFEKEALTLLGIGERYFTPEGIEFYGKLNLMKAGIGYADAVTTVSAAYAREILTPEFGSGLEGYLQVHRAKLTGIVNGIDTEHFSPGSDKALARPYKTPRGKAFNKARYLEETGLVGSEKPLFIFIGRFTWQKGMDMLIGALPEMAEHPCNIAILGEGESKYRKQIALRTAGLENVHLLFGYDEPLAHRMYAAADFLLMPSLFEPCGLNQLIAMHYGTLPVVRRVGGLADTVHPLSDCEKTAEAGCGICFESATKEALMEAFDEAMALYGEGERFRKAAAHDMTLDVSWRHSASSYADLYRKISEGAVE